MILLYMYVMSPEEVEQSHKEIDEWINSLDYDTKYNIRKLLQPLMNQLECDHWFFNSRSDEILNRCYWCGFKKPKDYNLFLNWMNDVDTSYFNIEDKLSGSKNKKGNIQWYFQLGFKSVYYELFKKKCNVEDIAILFAHNHYEKVSYNNEQANKRIRDFRNSSDTIKTVNKMNKLLKRNNLKFFRY